MSMQALGKGRLSASPATPNSSDKVLSFLMSAAGTAITHTTLGGKEALDVNVANPITVNVDGFYNVTTNAIPDTVGSIAFTRGASPASTDLTFRHTGGTTNADSIVAANAQALDVNAFALAFNGVTWDRRLGTAGAAHSHLASQAAGFKVQVKDEATVLKATAETVGITVAQVATTSLTGRTSIAVYNNSDAPIYLGGTGVTTTAGMPVFPGGYYTTRLAASGSLFAIGEVASQNIRVVETA